MHSGGPTVASGGAMAISLYVFHFFNKFKVFLLVTLCLMMLWAAFSYFVDSGQTIPKLKSVGEHFGKRTVRRKKR